MKTDDEKPPAITLAEHAHAAMLANVAQHFADAICDSTPAAGALVVVFDGKKTEGICARVPPEWGPEMPAVLRRIADLVESGRGHYYPGTRQ